MARWTLGLIVLSSGCSLLVPGNDGLTPDLVDGGQVDRDAGRDTGVEPGTDAGPACESELTECGGDCVDTQTDLAHCGSCDNACAATDVCREGACFDPVVDVAAGPTHACVVRASGAVLCWGTNDFGQLGAGDFEWRKEPHTVADVDDAVGVSAGGLPIGGFNGITCVTRASGQVWCWGANGGGQLGDGTMELRNLPVRAGTLSSVVHAETGAGFSCARRAPVPQVFCWGSVLLDGPVLLEPTAVSGLPCSPTSIDAVSVSARHACALDGDGAVWCWGMNNLGQLGDATTDDSSAARPVGLSGVVEVVTGLTHTCARQESGQVWCWGSAGQLGVGMSGMTAVSTPQELTTLPNATRIFSGSNALTTCALRPDGSLWCWGVDLVETVRTGTQTFNASPVEQTGFGAVNEVSVGFAYACALRPSGDVACWGENEHGQLGDGTMENRLLPTPVVLP